MLFLPELWLPGKPSSSHKLNTAADKKTKTRLENLYYDKLKHKSLSQYIDKLTEIHSALKVQISGSEMIFLPELWIPGKPSLSHKLNKAAHRKQRLD
jgi:predicted amidohydrolase